MTPVIAPELVCAAAGTMARVNSAIHNIIVPEWLCMNLRCIDSPLLLADLTVVKQKIAPSQTTRCSLVSKYTTNVHGCGYGARAANSAFDGEVRQAEDAFERAPKLALEQFSRTHLAVH